MSKTNNDPLLTSLTGKLGKTLSFRQIRGKKYLVKASKDRDASAPKQLVVQRRFKNAVQYAKWQTDTAKSGNPNVAESRALYEKGITADKTSAYAVAFSDYLKVPEVHVIDAQEYQGAIGDVIEVEASDDFMVTAVKLVITSADGTVLERGNAVMSVDSNLKWLYKATVANSVRAGTTLMATAVDRPGNTGSLQVVL
jgi:hypothetical protein